MTYLGYVILFYFCIISKIPNPIISQIGKNNTFLPKSTTWLMAFHCCHWNCRQIMSSAQIHTQPLKPNPPFLSRKITYVGRNSLTCSATLIHYLPQRKLYICVIYNYFTNNHILCYILLVYRKIQIQSCLPLLCSSKNEKEKERIYVRMYIIISIWIQAALVL